MGVQLARHHSPPPDSWLIATYIAGCTEDSRKVGSVARFLLAPWGGACHHSHVTGPYQRGSWVGRPFRRLRRWARHTPNGTIALNMICVGIALILVAIIIAITVL